MRSPVGRLVASLVFVGILVLISLAGIANGLRPVQGLDLVGGLSVVLEGPTHTSKAVMTQALDKIRQRVDALGVAEPNISLLGNNLIQVQLPGVGSPGYVRTKGNLYCAYSPDHKELACYKTRADAQAKAESVGVQHVLEIIGKTARLEERPVLQVVNPGTAQYKKLPSNLPVVKGNPTTGQLITYQSASGARFRDGSDPKMILGPVTITGANLTKAQAQFVSSTSSSTNAQAGWQVAFSLDSAGASKFANTTRQLVSLPSPRNQLAIVVDNVVISSPVVQSPITDGQGVITGNFSEAEVKNLAVVLQSGALPVQLTRSNVQTISPTLGKQSLQEGLVAGIVGLIALMLYLVFYYRLLGIVTWVGMMIWAILAIALISYLGHAVGYALTLAGIAGIIVSLGITVDSYIVFYERLKDEVRHGKSLRSAVQPAFKRAWKTIVAADIVTAIAAAVLYVVSIGSVRGFALTLGISTLLDLGVVWFYKRPTVFLLARSKRLAELPGFGLRSGVAADPVPVAGGEK